MQQSALPFCAVLLTKQAFPTCGGQAVTRMRWIPTNGQGTGPFDRFKIAKIFQISRSIRGDFRQAARGRKPAWRSWVVAIQWQTAQAAMSSGTSQPRLAGK
jgi:hypothetical protein